MQIVIGAAVFAVGAVFGAWLILAGQASTKNRAGGKIQEAFLKGMEDAAHCKKRNAHKIP